MIDSIDWKLLGTAVEHYKSLGFEYVEVPWKVTPASAEVTCPPAGTIEEVDGLALIASGEQGFVDLEIDGLMPLFTNNVNFVTCTPCFRQTDAGRSAIHHPYFMKVELYVRCPDQAMTKIVARELATSGRRYMGALADELAVSTPKFQFVYMPDGVGVDIELNGVEVASYGGRFHKEVGWWAYGTGLALPRFTQAMEIDDEV